MTERTAFKQEQRRVAWAMGIAFCTTIIALGIAAMQTPAAPVAPFDARLEFALRTNVFVIVWLMAAIGNVARLRFFSEEDIAGSSAAAGSTQVRQASGILQNTLEQVSLAIFAHVVVAATFQCSNALIQALTCLFFIGRLLFWAGYKRGASGRAFGFALTFYPSVIALIASAIAILFGQGNL